MAEEIAKEYYTDQGHSVYQCERRLISMLFGTLCAPVVQDFADSRVRQVFRGSTKGWTSATSATPLISIALPEDFGTPAFYKRRREKFEELFLEYNALDIKTVFEELLIPSESLRDYLWVNDDSAIDLGRVALDVVPEATLLKWVAWVAQDFWGRQPGWPDFFLTRGDDYLFAEVKTQHDRLSLEQMQWFRWACNEADIPSEILRIKRLAQI